MYAFKILSHKSFQLWDTAIIFNGVKGSYRKSMWKYVSTWWFNFTKKKKNPLLKSTTKKLLKMVFFMTPSSFKISCQGMHVNSCRTNLYNNKIQLVETHFHLLFHPSYKATKSSIEDSRLEFLPWQTWVHFFSKRPRELTVINGSGRGTAAPTWGLALSSVFI